MSQIDLVHVPGEPAAFRVYPDGFSGPVVDIDAGELVSWICGFGREVLREHGAICGWDVGATATMRGCRPAGRCPAMNALHQRCGGPAGHEGAHNYISEPSSKDTAGDSDTCADLQRQLAECQAELSAARREVDDLTAIGPIRTIVREEIERSVKPEVFRANMVRLREAGLLPSTASTDDRVVAELRTKLKEVWLALGSPASESGHPYDATVAAARLARADLEEVEATMDAACAKLGAAFGWSLELSCGTGIAGVSQAVIDALDDARKETHELRNQLAYGQTSLAERMLREENDDRGAQLAEIDEVLGSGPLELPVAAARRVMAELKDACEFRDNLCARVTQVEQALNEKNTALYEMERSLARAQVEISTALGHSSTPQWPAIIGSVRTAVTELAEMRGINRDLESPDRFSMLVIRGRRPTDAENQAWRVICEDGLIVKNSFGPCGPSGDVLGDVDRASARASERMAHAAATEKSRIEYESLITELADIMEPVLTTTMVSVTGSLKALVREVVELRGLANAPCSDARGHQFCDADGNRGYLYCQRGCGTTTKHAGDPVLHIALASLITAMALDDRDWTMNQTDAWIYGIIVGWDRQALAALSEQHSMGEAAGAIITASHGAVVEFLAARP